MSRRILSLCDYSGTWSQPYVDAGYDVLRIDLQRDGRDIRLLEREEGVHGILAAPPAPVLRHPVTAGNGLMMICVRL